MVSRLLKLPTRVRWRGALNHVIGVSPSNIDIGLRRIRRGILNRARLLEKMGTVPPEILTPSNADYLEKLRSEVLDKVKLLNVRVLSPYSFASINPYTGIDTHSSSGGIYRRCSFPRDFYSTVTVPPCGSREYLPTTPYTGSPFLRHNRFQSMLTKDDKEYEIIAATGSPAAKGGFGTVFLGYSPKLGKMALKRPTTTSADTRRVSTESSSVAWTLT